MPHAFFSPAAQPRVLADPRRRPPCRRRNPARPDPITPLEPRRLLAAFSATSADDVIHIFGRPGDMHVVINGVDHTTTDTDVLVNASGGEDTVYLGAIQQTGFTVNLTLRLGAGNDRVTNFNPAAGTGSLIEVGPLNITVFGDAGTDTIALDDTDSPITAAGRTYQFGHRENLGDPSVMTFSRGVSGHTTIRHESVEEFFVDAGSGPDTAYLYQKPGGMNLSVTGGGGDDRFTGGHREFDADGWVSGTTTLSGGTGADSVLFVDQADQTSTPGAPASLTLAGFTLSKGSTGFTYSGFESVSLLPPYLDTINIIGPSSSVSSLTVRTGPFNTVNLLLAVPAATTVVLDHGVTVNVGNGDLSAVGGAVTLTPGVGVQTNVLNLNDHGAPAGHVHTLTATGYTRSGSGGVPSAVVNYSTGLANINLAAGQGADWLAVESSPPAPPCHCAATAATTRSTPPAAASRRSAPR